MGQTLSHGVYLPNEGERNCYAGLASNWQILNTAVGNIAEKAPLVHTHGNITNDGKVGTTANLPLITGTGGAIQAGSFGTSANTFCEGNDSRLSDARTPLSHTHTKSDVTDLLNSNFIPSANNSYDLGSSSYQWNNVYSKNYFYNGTAWGLDKSNEWTGNNTFTSTPTVKKNSAGDLLNLIDDTINTSNEDENGLPLTGHTNALKIRGRDFNIIPCMLTGQVFTNGDTSTELRAYKYKDISSTTSSAILSLRYNYNDNNGTVSFRNIGYIIPIVTNTTDLGTPSTQWKSIYAKNYYYNGTQWGLDQNNVWTGDNTFKGIYQNQGDTNYIIPRGTNTVKGDLTTSGSFALMFKDKNNGNLATSGIAYLTLGQNSSGSYANIGVETVGSTDSTRHSNSITLKIDPTTNDNTAQFYPVNNNATDLGISTNQWNNVYSKRVNTQTLNGINPGALSLPVTALNNTYDISGNITDLTGGNNSITAARTGWIFVKSDNATEISIENTTTGMGASDHSASAATLMVSVPVTSGESVNIIANCTSIDKAYLLPCQGNV